MHLRAKTRLTRTSPTALTWALLIVPALALLGVARVASLNLLEQRSPPIRIAMNPWPGYEVLYLAQELGLYEEEGVDVRIIEVCSLTDAVRAMRQGHADAMACSLIEAVHLARDGVGVGVVYAFDASHGADVLLARDDVRSIAELKGRRVGVEAGTLTIVLLEAALRSAGLALDDVTIVDLDPLEMPGAFRASNVDAAVCYPPASMQILDLGNAHPLYSSADIPDTILDVLAVSGDLLRARPDEARAMLRAVRRASELTRTHPDLTDPIMASREGLTVERFRSARSNGIRQFSPSDQARLFDPNGPLERALRAAADAVTLSDPPDNPGASRLPEITRVLAEDDR